VNRGLIGAGIFLLLLLVAFRQPVAASLGLSVLMLAVYIPMGYTIDRFFYNRRQAAARRAGERS
jgi:hypothetical protein